MNSTAYILASPIMAGTNQRNDYSPRSINTRTINFTGSGSYEYIRPAEAMHASFNGAKIQSVQAVYKCSSYEGKPVTNIAYVANFLKGFYSYVKPIQPASMHGNGYEVIKNQLITPTNFTTNLTAPGNIIKAKFYIVHTYKEPYYYYVVGTKQVIEIMSETDNFCCNVYRAAKKTTSLLCYSKEYVQVLNRLGKYVRRTSSIIQPITNSNYRSANRRYTVSSYTNNIQVKSFRSVLTSRSMTSYVDRITSENKKFAYALRNNDAFIDCINNLTNLQWPPSRNKLIAIEANIKSHAITINITSKEIIMKLEERRIEVINMSKDCQIGNTVRFTAMFRNWDTTLIDPTKIDFKVITTDQQIVFHTDCAAKQTTGTYFVDYIADTVGSFICEWTAIIDGMPSVKRSSFKVKQTL